MLLAHHLRLSRLSNRTSQIVNDAGRSLTMLSMTALRRLRYSRPHWAWLQPVWQPWATEPFLGPSGRLPRCCRLGHRWGRSRAPRLYIPTLHLGRRHVADSVCWTGSHSFGSDIYNSQSQENGRIFDWEARNIRYSPGHRWPLVLTYGVLVVLLGRGA